MATTIGTGGGRTVSLDGPGPRRELPDCEPSPPFHLAAHPRQWQVDRAEKRLVPLLTRYAVQPGLHGASDPRDTRSAAHTAGDAGAIVLPVAITRDAPGGHDGYLVAHTVRRGTHHCTAWEQPIPGTQRKRRDAEGYAAFLRWLVDSGTVPGPAEHVIEAEIEALEKLHRIHARKAATDPVEAETAERIAEDLAVWRAALAPEPAPAPTPKRRRKAAEES